MSAETEKKGWRAYTEEMTKVIAGFPEGSPAKKVSAEAFSEIQDFLFSDESYRQEPLELSKMEKGDLRQILSTRKNDFITLTNFTEPQYMLAQRCLITLGSNCAKSKTVAPLVEAWQKIKDSGMILKPNFLSTFLYVLGLEEQYSDISLEVATFHDMLYGSTESSIYLRIKALVAMGDPSRAEELLEKLPVRISKMLVLRPV